MCVQVQEKILYRSLQCVGVRVQEKILSRTSSLQCVGVRVQVQEKIL